MTAKEFVKLFTEQRECDLKTYFSQSIETQVGLMIQELELNGDKLNHLKNIVKLILNESHYNVLCALDGTAGLGGDSRKQQFYKLQVDGENELIYGFGELQAEGSEAFEDECKDFVKFI